MTETRTETRLRTGGCACGQLTFETRGEPKRVGLCHCMTCRKISGAPVSAYVIFAVDQVTISGDFRSWSATPKTEDCFCPICGSQVFARYSDIEIEIRLGGQDLPARLFRALEVLDRERQTSRGPLISYIDVSQAKRAVVGLVTGKQTVAEPLESARR